MVEVVLYDAAGCGLCARALALLEAEAPRLGFRLRRIPIDGDDELERLYRIDLPVILITAIRRSRVPSPRGRCSAPWSAHKLVVARRVRDTAFRLLTRRCATVCY